MKSRLLSFRTPPSGAAKRTAAGASRNAWDQQLARVIAVLQEMDREQLVLSEVFAKAIVGSKETLRP